MYITMHSTFPNISFNFDDKSNYRSKYNLTDQCLRKQHLNIYPPKKDSMNKVTQTRKKKIPIYQSIRRESNQEQRRGRSEKEGFKARRIRRILPRICRTQPDNAADPWKFLWSNLNERERERGRGEGKSTKGWLEGGWVAGMLISRCSCAVTL